MAPPKLKLYVDIVSPFAYEAFWALENLPTFKKVDKTYVPILLGGLMKQCANRAPIEITNKATWINLERLRWAKLYNIPMKEELPAGFPVLTIKTERALVAISQKLPEKLVPSISALYHAFFVDHAKIGDEQVIAQVLAKVLDKTQLEQILAASQTAEVKERLVKNTQAAFDDQAFGLPWFVATNSKGETQKYWGFDHLGQVADFLELDRPTSGGWRAVL